MGEVGRRTELGTSLSSLKETSAFFVDKEGEALLTVKCRDEVEG